MFTLPRIEWYATITSVASRGGGRIDLVTEFSLFAKKIHFYTSLLYRSNLIRRNLPRSLWERVLKIKYLRLTDARGSI